MSQVQEVIKTLAGMKRDDLMVELQRRLYADAARDGFDSAIKLNIRLAYNLGRLAASQDWLDKTIKAEIERVNAAGVQ